MERKRIGDWIVEIDVERTRRFYEGYHRITEGCDCLYCKNYAEAAVRFPRPVLEFFQSLGIDPAKEGEISEYCENEDGTHLYGGFYHIVGRLVSGPDCWVKASEDLRHLDGNMVEICGFTFGFTYGLSLLPDEFPEPAVQLEFQGNVPWVLHERT